MIAVALALSLLAMPRVKTGQSFTSALRSATYKILHDRWSLVVVGLLAFSEFGLSRACAAQGRGEDALRKMAPHLSFPSSGVPGIVIGMILLPIAFGLMWLAFVTFI
jgi:hypothetical protein